jgi:hypothetical protein
MRGIKALHTNYTRSYVIYVHVGKGHYFKCAYYRIHKLWAVFLLLGSGSASGESSTIWHYLMLGLHETLRCQLCACDVTSSRAQE